MKKVLQKNIMMGLLVVPLYWGYSQHHFENLIQIFSTPVKNESDFITSLLNKNISRIPSSDFNSTESQMPEKAFDAQFLISVKSQNPKGNLVEFNFNDPQKLGIKESEYSSAYRAHLKFFANPNLPSGLDYLKKETASYTLPQKQLLLSMLGSKLSAGYSNTGTQNPDLEGLFLNIKNNQTEGGVCGDIHLFIQELSKSLGFSNTGTLTVNQQKVSSGKSGNGHVVSYFRDPQTGNYFIQNYSMIYSTQAQTVQEASEIATKIAGAYTSVSYIKGENGKVHVYVPNTARWVKEQLDSRQNSQYQSGLQIQVGNDEFRFQGHVGTKEAHIYLGGSQTSTDEGLYSLSYIGVAGAADKQIPLSDSWIDEINLHANYSLGVFEVSTPSEISSNKKRSLQRAFGKLTLSGSARVNRTTGTLELISEGDTNISGPKGLAGGSGQSELNLTLQQSYDQLSYLVRRNVALVPSYLGNSSATSNPKPKTQYDQFEIIYIPNDKDSKAYVRSGSSLYFLEGLSSNSPAAIRQELQSTVNLPKNTIFTVGVDYSRFIRNPNNDPFYNIPSTKKLTLGLIKSLPETGIKIGAEVSRIQGATSTPFAAFDNSPEGTNGRRIAGRVFIKIPLFGKN